MENMDIKKIKVSAGRTFNHPYEQYSNLRFDIHLEAELREGADYMQCVQALQHDAETRAEDHKAALLKDIYLLEEQARVNSKVSDIERRIREANAELERMRKWQEENGPGNGYTPLISRVMDDHEINDEDLPF